MPLRSKKEDAVLLCLYVFVGERIRKERGERIKKEWKEMLKMLKNGVVAKYPKIIQHFIVPYNQSINFTFFFTEPNKSKHTINIF